MPNNCMHLLTLYLRFVSHKLALRHPLYKPKCLLPETDGNGAQYEREQRWPWSLEVLLPREPEGHGRGGRRGAYPWNGHLHGGRRRSSAVEDRDEQARAEGNGGVAEPGAQRCRWRSRSHVAAAAAEPGAVAACAAQAAHEESREREASERRVDACTPKHTGGELKFVLFLVGYVYINLYRVPIFWKVRRSLTL